MYHFLNLPQSSWGWALVGAYEAAQWSDSAFAAGVRAALGDCAFLVGELQTTTWAAIQDALGVEDRALWEALRAIGRQEEYSKVAVLLYHATSESLSQAWAATAQARVKGAEAAAQAIWVKMFDQQRRWIRTNHPEIDPLLKRAGVREADLGVLADAIELGFASPKRAGEWVAKARPVAAAYYQALREISALPITDPEYWGIAHYGRGHALGQLLLMTDSYPPAMAWLDSLQRKDERATLVAIIQAALGEPVTGQLRGLPIPLRRYLRWYVL